MADTEVSLEDGNKKREGKEVKNVQSKWAKIRLGVEIRRGVECEAVWQLKELQVEAQDVPSPKKKKAIALFKE